MSETIDNILDIAQSLVQQRGFNAFSYADISREIGIKTASIHYHFPTKGDLGKSLVERYMTDFLKQLKRIDDSETDEIGKLTEFLDLYLDTLDEGKMCPCVMLGSDINTLPDEVQAEVRKFFVENENWLAKVFRDGRNGQTLNIDGNTDMKAKLFLSSVYGGLLLSKAMNSEARFITLAQDLISSVATKK